MIDALRIDGYKSLKDISLSLGNLNVLVGPNASGKSSIIQTLLLLRQSADKEGNVDGLHLSGQLYEAGTAQDALHPASDYELGISLRVDGNAIEFSFRHDRADTDHATMRVLPAEVTRRLPSVLFDRGDGFAYLNAERIGPRVAYGLLPDEFHLGGMVGKHGEFTAAVLSRAKTGIVLVDGGQSLVGNFATAPKRLDNVDFAAELSASQGRLDIVCNLMLRWILPGNEFDAQEHEQSDSASLRFIRDPLATKTSVRATHIGFGLIYTLPIITAALALRPGGLMVVENPEAHLHPFSQSRIGVFLAMMAASGRQIVLETHSDHVINGVRIALKYEIIRAEQVHIHFLSKSASADTSAATVITAQQNGRLSPWPSGFFDQIENDLAKL